MARAAWLALFLVACARPSASGSPPAAKASDPPPMGSVTVLPPPEPEGDWVAAVRAEDFTEAARRLAGLDPERGSRPEVRYARARVFFGLRDFKSALSLLDGLEKDLPLLRTEIARD